ncbi:formylglycine-generating enzyme family protein [Myxococcota bacterium]|nr:formylglycine-generating enzyme family protein [Myxococcota bacterium]
MRYAYALYLALALAPSAAAQVTTVEGMEWVQIEGGAFQMGGLKGRAEKQPLHPVTLAAFALSKTEVTVAQYRACVEAKACTPPTPMSRDPLCNWGYADRDAHPINCVSWAQAQAFAAWAGGRLPSEAEFEYAARSRGQDAKYPWGSAKATCEHAVMHPRGGLKGCEAERTWPVCSKPKGHTAQGLCDMAGNVYEWTADVHFEGAAPPADGKPRQGEGTQRVYRGGGWGSPASALTTTSRFKREGKNRFNGLGFRVAR